MNTRRSNGYKEKESMQGQGMDTRRSHGWMSERMDRWMNMVGGW